MSIKELEEEVDKIIAQYSNPKIGKQTLKCIIGNVMKVARNRIDGKLVMEIVTKKLKNLGFSYYINN